MWYNIFNAAGEKLPQRIFITAGTPEELELFIAANTPEGCTLQPDTGEPEENPQLTLL